MNTEELISQLNEVCQKMQKEYSKTMRRSHRDGIDYVLHYLYTVDHTVSQSNLCQAMNVTPPRVSAILKTMEAKDLINRVADDDDRRRICITLTDEGRRTVKEKCARQLNYTKNIVDTIGVDEAENLLRILSTLVDSRENQI